MYGMFQTMCCNQSAWRALTSHQRAIFCLALRHLKGVQGVKVSGVPVNFSGQNGLIATEIGKETKFSVEGAIREEYRNVTAPFKQYVQNEVRDGNNPDSTLHPRDDNFRIVMIRSVLRAQKFEMSVGGTSASDPETVAQVSIAIPGVEIASIRVRAGAKLTCGSGKASYNGELPPSLFLQRCGKRPTLYWQRGG